MFSHSGLYGASRVFVSGESVAAETVASIPSPTKFCSTIKIIRSASRPTRNCGCWVAHPGGMKSASLLSTLTSRSNKKLSCTVRPKGGSYFLP